MTLLRALLVYLSLRSVTTAMFVTLATIGPSAEPPAVKVEVNPKVQLVHPRKGGEVYLKLTVERNALNRAVCVAVDGTTFRSSCFDHVGEAAPYRLEWWVKGLSAGQYVVGVAVQRADGSVVRASDKFCLSDGQDPCF